MNTKQLTATTLRNACIEAEHRYLEALEKWHQQTVEGHGADFSETFQKAFCLPALEKDLDSKKCYYHQCRMSYDTYVLEALG